MRSIFRKMSARAFTLIELLVSMTVLTLLILTVSQLVSGTTSVSTANRQHLDADGQARLVFDRLALDFSRMLKRQDVDYIFKNDALPLSQTGNDAFFFYSEAPAYFDNTTATAAATAQSPLALIGYRIGLAGSAAPYQLTRLGKGLTWDGPTGTPDPNGSSIAPGSIVYLTPAATPSANATPTPDPNSTFAGRWPTNIGTASNGYADGVDTSYHVIADQVCRLEICFLLKPIPASGLPAVYSINPYRGTPGHKAVNGLQDVRAIVVALAVLDRTSRQLATDLSHMATALPDITADNLAASPPILMGKVWQDKINAGTFAADAQIPKAAAAQVRVYQRHFYLDTN